jgi:hypothetical protein
MSQAIDVFCAAKHKLKRLEEEYAVKRKPLNDRVSKIRAEVKAYMKKHNLCCLPVTLTEEGQPIKKYLRFSKTASCTELNTEGLERAIDKITEADLKTCYADLQEEAAEKEAKQSRKRRKGADGEKVGPTKITILDVWDAVATEKIRQEHLRQSETLKLDKSPPKNFPEQYQAPEAIQKLVMEWLSKTAELTKLTEEAEARCEKCEKIVEEKEPAVCQFLHNLPGDSKAQEVNLAFHNEVKTFHLVQKESCPKVHVRITAFKPLIRQSLQHVLQQVSSFEAACSPAIKQEMVRHLTRHFQQYEKDHQKPTTYVSLDKVARKSRA